jgi:hypothetical protein
MNHAARPASRAASRQLIAHMTVRVRYAIRDSLWLLGMCGCVMTWSLEAQLLELTHMMSDEPL